MSCGLNHVKINLQIIHMYLHPPITVIFLYVFAFQHRMTFQFRKEISPRFFSFLFLFFVFTFHFSFRCICEVAASLFVDCGCECRAHCVSLLQFRRLSASSDGWAAAQSSAAQRQRPSAPPH